MRKQATLLTLLILTLTLLPLANAVDVDTNGQLVNTAARAVFSTNAGTYYIFYKDASTNHLLYAYSSNALDWTEVTLVSSPVNAYTVYYDNYTEKVGVAYVGVDNSNNPANVYFILCTVGSSPVLSCGSPATVLTGSYPAPPSLSKYKQYWIIVTSYLTAGNEYWVYGAVSTR